MELNDLLGRTSEWLKGIGPDSEIVISSRIRLARNLKRFPFSQWANKRQAEETLSVVRDALVASPYLEGAMYLNMANINNVDRQFLVERHLVSNEFTLNPMHKMVVISADETTSIMINEEDHLRLQVMQSGFNLKSCWDIIDKLDTDLDARLDYAFSVELGYLTACPTNTGTGMRGSAMVHLPSLVMTRQMGKVVHAINKLGLTVRGLYGEGTEATGDLFQISNQVTLGQSEADILGNLSQIVAQVIGYEKDARSSLSSRNRRGLEDRIWRAFGTLKNAHIITSAEATQLLSYVRLGVEMGIVADIDRWKVNELFILIQPAHLQKLEQKALNANQRDTKRADLIREKLRNSK